MINDTEKLSEGKHRKTTLSYFGYAQKATSKQAAVNEAIGDLMDEAISIQKAEKHASKKKIKIVDDIAMEKKNLDRNRENMSDAEYERRRQKLADKALLMITGDEKESDEDGSDLEEEEEDDDDDMNGGEYQSMMEIAD